MSENDAYLLSAGEGSDNRIYKTEDGGGIWTLQFEAGDDPRFFYDCFDFWTPDRGITFADGMDGRFPVIKTTDGENWQDIGNQLPARRVRQGLPPAAPASRSRAGTERGSGPVVEDGENTRHHQRG